MRKIRHITTALVLAVALIVNVLCGCGTANAGNNSGAETPATTTANAEAEPQISGEAPTGPEAELAGHQVVAEDPDGNNDIGGDYGLGDPDADDEDNQTGVPEEPEEEVPAPGGHGGYRYEVGNTAVYTENPIDRWVTYNAEKGSYTLDVYQMLTDLWCADGGTISGNDRAYFFIKDGEEAGGVYFRVPDANYEFRFHSFTVYRTVDGERHPTSPTMYSYDGCEDRSEYMIVLSDPKRSVHKDLAVLLLKAVEEAEKDPERNNVLSGLTLGPNYHVDDSIN